MSDFDPSTVVSPTGDTIKIAVVASFSGPSALNGMLYWLNTQWVANDINKRGGIYVDGKKKLVEIIKADHMGKADQCKKVCERMVLQEKVHAFWGTDASSMMRIINEVADKYKVISINAMWPGRYPDECKQLLPLCLSGYLFNRTGRPRPLPIITVKCEKRKRSFTSSVRITPSVTKWLRGSRKV